jgi:Anti-sigma-K factor rskA, C-terminal/Putative zinc-finger
MSSDIHALSGAYAVDALDDIERAQFERHLAECSACTSEVASLRDASAFLAETTIGTPSAELRNRVLADITNVRPLPPVVEQAPEPPRRRRLVTLLAAAAAVVAIGVGGIVWHQVSDEPSRDQISEIQAAPDVQHVTVPVGDGGSATVYRSKQLNKAAIVTQGMPAAPSGHQYVLWLQHGSMMTQAGVMPEGADNEVVFSGDAASADGAAISIEDAGSVPTQPSDDIAAVFSFDS